MRLCHLQFTFSLKFPPIIGELIAQLKVLSLDFTGYFRLGCMYDEWTFYSHFSATVLLTPVLAGAAFSMYWYQLLRIKMRVSEGAKMVTETGLASLRANQRRTVAKGKAQDWKEDTEPVVSEGDKVNPADYHEHCTICSIEFDLTDDGTRRALNCGHCFCTKCIRLLLADEFYGTGDLVGADKELLCPLNYTATDKHWYSKDKAKNWIGNGRSGLVLQTQVVGDKKLLKEATAKLETAKSHLMNEIDRANLLRENNNVAADDDTVNWIESEDDLAKALQEKEDDVALAQEALDAATSATTTKPMKECDKDGGTTTVKGGKVENISRKLSSSEKTKEDIVQLGGIMQSLARVGPPGALNPAFADEIQFRLTNQVCCQPCAFTRCVPNACFASWRHIGITTHVSSVLQFLYVVFFITTALYPVVSQTIFQTFLCQQLEPPTCEAPAGATASQISECAFPAGENPDGGFLFSAWSAEECAAGCVFHEAEVKLLADFQVDCSDSEHLALEAFAVLLVLAYPIGLPAALLGVLFINRRELVKEASKRRDYFSPLVGAYRKEVWWWEAVEMLRKVTFTGLLIFFDRGSLYQLAVAIQASAVFTALAVYFRPFKKRFNNNCASTRYSVCDQRCLLIQAVCVCVCV